MQQDASANPRQPSRGGCATRKIQSLFALLVKSSTTHLPPIPNQGSHESDKLHSGVKDVASTVRPLLGDSTPVIGKCIFSLVEEILEQILDILLDKDRLARRYGLSFEDSCAIEIAWEVSNLVIRPFRRYFPWRNPRTRDPTDTDDYPNLILAKRR